jgi:hypothetical protein
LGAPWRSGPAVDRVADLCGACVRGSGVDGGGVTVMTSSGTGVALYATDSISSTIEDLQLTLGEGPCVDAAASGFPVLVADLSDPSGGIGRRWPLFQAEASRIGAAAVFAFPIRIGAIGLGTLDLFRQSPGPLHDPELTQALLCVDELGTALLDFEAHQHGEDLLSPRMVVHQAAGVAMVQLDTTIEEAMARLRATAYAEDVSINALAADVVSGRRRLFKEEP